MTMTAVPTQTLLNGIDMQELEAAAMAVASSAEAAQTTFRVATSWEGKFRSRSDVESYDLGGKRIPRRHRIRSDEPLELLGTNEAPNPQDLLLAALNACMMVGFVVNATKLGVRIDSLVIDSTLDLDLRGAFGLDPTIPAGASKILYTIHVKGDGTSEQWEEIHNAVKMVSPNRFHLTQPIELESRLIVG